MENEQKLRLYAITCAALNAAEKELDPHEDNMEIVIAFSIVWSNAMGLESGIEFYRRIEKAEKLLGFGE